MERLISKSAGNKFQIKKGDYQIHLFLQSLHLTSEKLKNTKQNPISPIIKLKTRSVIRQVNESYSIKNNEYFYNSHIFIDNLTINNQNDFEKSKIIIEVYDKHANSIEDYIGIYELSFSFIYFSSNDHSINNTYIALSNIKSKDCYSDINGYIKISLALLHSDDNRVFLYNNNDGMRKDSILYPSHVKTEYFQLKIALMKGEGFQISDLSNKNDITICISYNDKKVISKESCVIEKTKIVVWNEVFYIPFFVPFFSKEVFFEIFNDKKRIGWLTLLLDDVLNKKYIKPVYKSIYNNEFHSQTPSFLGSTWIGRVYLSASASQTDDPKMGKDDLFLTSFLEGDDKKYIWRYEFELVEALYLPYDNTTYSVVFSYEDLSVVSSQKYVHNGEEDLSVYDWDFQGKQEFSSNFNEVNDLSDLIVSLYIDKTDNNSKRRICFQRLDSKIFYNNEETVYLKLIPDSCLSDNLKAWLMVLLKVKIKLTRHEMSGKSEEIVKDYIGSKKTKENTIVFNVFQSKNFNPSDSNGKSDAYIEVSCKGKTQSTSVKYDQVNGIWNESLVFSNIQFDVLDKESWPIILMKYKDKDEVVGYSFLLIDSSSYQINKLESLRPKWKKFQNCKTEKEEGEVLISVFLIEKESTFVVDEETAIKSIDLPSVYGNYCCYDVDLNIVGLRNLVPNGIVPVGRAFVHFDLNSVIDPTHKKDKVFEIRPVKTDPIYKGDNPTICSKVNFKINLPDDEMYVPKITCRVYDYLLNSLKESSYLGAFCIDLNEAVRKTKEWYNQNTNTTTVSSSLKSTEDVLYNKNNLSIKNRYIHINQSTNFNPSPSSSFSYVKVKEIELVDMKNTSNKHDYVELTDNDESLSIIEKERSVQLKEVLLSKKDSFSKRLDSKLDLIDDLVLKKVRLEEFRQDIDRNEVVLYPQFIRKGVYGIDRECIVEDEDFVPSNTLYKSIGYVDFNINQVDLDENSNLLTNMTYEKGKCYKTKHYRRIYHKELEKERSVKLSCPFLKIPIRRREMKTQSGDVSLYSKVIKRNDVDLNEKDEFDLNRQFEFGYFKSFVHVIDERKKSEFNSFNQTLSVGNQNTNNEFRNYLRFKDISQQLMNRKEYIVRVYILNIFDLSISSDHDVHLKITLNDKEYTIPNPENTIENTSFDIYNIYE